MLVGDIHKKLAHRHSNGIIADTRELYVPDQVVGGIIDAVILYYDLYFSS